MNRWGRDRMTLFRTARRFSAGRSLSELGFHRFSTVPTSARQLGPDPRGSHPWPLTFVGDVARRMVLLLVLSASLVNSPTGWAQQPPTVGYVYPASGRAGTTVDIQLGGYDLTPDTQFFVHDARVTLEITGPPSPLLYPGAPHWFGPRAINANKPYGIPREIPARLTLPADLPPGIIHWQAANANGVSALGQFYVSHDSLEIKEEDCPLMLWPSTNRDPIPAAQYRQLASLPVAISGRLQRKEEVDRYLLVAPRDGLITCELLGPALGLPLNAILEVRDQNGRLIVNAGDPAGRGLGATWLAKAGQTYELMLHDLDYRGNRGVVYRLSLYAAPRVVATLPQRAQRGTTRDVQFVGYGVATGQPQLEVVTRSMTFPSDSKLTWFSYRFETPFGQPPEVLFSLTDLPESIETEQPVVDAIAASSAETSGSSGEQAAAQIAAQAAARAVETSPFSERQLSIPGAVTGVYDDPLRDETYWIEAKKDEAWWMEVESSAKAAPLDLVLTVYQADGKQLITADDLPGTTNAGLLFKAPADGRYRIVVSDLATALLAGASATSTLASSASGSHADLAEATPAIAESATAPRIADQADPLASSRRLDRDRFYRLAVTRPTAGFQLKVSTQVTVVVGDPPVEIPAKGRAPNAKSGLLTCEITRGPGFVDPVSIQLAQLPAGVSAPAEVTIPADANSVSIPLVCPAEAATWAGLVHVHARSVPPAEAAASDGATPETSPVYEQTAAVLIVPVMKPRAVVQPFYPDAARTVSRGATYPAPVVIERLEGYDGEVELQMAGMPDRVRQGILGGMLTVPAGVTQIDYPLYLPEFVQTDRTSRIFLNAIVRLADGQGNVRHLVNRMVKRITMNVEGAVLKVTTATDDFVWNGNELEIPLQILRTPKLSGPVWVSLATDDYSQGPPIVQPDGPSDETIVPPGFRAKSVRFEPDQQQATLVLQAVGESLPAGEHRLLIESRGIRENMPVVSQTEIFVTVSQPAQTVDLHKQIDRLLAASSETNLPAAPRSDDAEFVRRVYLDLAGRIPTLAETTAFLDDTAADKRVSLVDRLLASPDYPRRMQEVFHSILIERRGNDPEWQAFLRNAFEQNLPWDAIARALARPPIDDEKLRGAAFFMTSRLISEGAMAPVDVPGLTRDFGRLLVGVDLQCAQCHDHLTIDDYAQRDFQALHMIFENLDKRSDVKFPAVSEKVMTQPKSFMSVFTQEPMETMPAVPGGKEIPIVKFASGEEFLVQPDRKTRTPGVPKFSPLTSLSKELTSKQNALFSKNITNRLWHLMLGRGLVEPLDLHHSGNPASHPEVLELLASEFAAHQCDLRWLLRELALTDAYQRSSRQSTELVAPVAANAPPNYQVGREKRMLAESLFWSMLIATGPLPTNAVAANGPPVAAESAAPPTASDAAATSSPATNSTINATASVRGDLEQQVAQSKDLQTLQELFIKSFANPAREPEYEFEPTVKGALFLMHDPRVLKLLTAQPGNLIDRLSQFDDSTALADHLFLSVLSRRPTPEDRQDVADYLATHADQRLTAITDLTWALLASTEFCLNH